MPRKASDLMMSERFPAPPIAVGLWILTSDCLWSTVRPAGHNGEWESIFGPVKPPAGLLVIRPKKGGALLRHLVRLAVNAGFIICDDPQEYLHRGLADLVTRHNN